MMMLVMALLIQVHGPDGHSISINPDHIVAMHETDRPNTDKYLVDVACIINTTDGKFASVTETCDQVREMIKRLQQREE